MVFKDLFRCTWTAFGAFIFYVGFPLYPCFAQDSTGQSLAVNDTVASTQPVSTSIHPVMQNVAGHSESEWSFAPEAMVTFGTIPVYGISLSLVHSRQKLHIGGNISMGYGRKSEILTMYWIPVGAETGFRRINVKENRILCGAGAEIGYDVMQVQRFSVQVGGQLGLWYLYDWMRDENGKKIFDSSGELGGLYDSLEVPSGKPGDLNSSKTYELGGPKLKVSYIGEKADLFTEAIALCNFSRFVVQVNAGVSIHLAARRPE